MAFLSSFILQDISPVLLFLGGLQTRSISWCWDPRHDGGRAAAADLPYSTTAQGCLLKPAHKGCKRLLFSFSKGLGRFKSHWENVQKRDEVFNNAIFVLDSVNSSRLPSLPSPLICAVGLRNRFKCRFWTWEVASFFCWGVSPPSQPSCGLTLQHPGSWRGWCWGCCCHKLGWIQRGTSGIDPQHLEFLLCWFSTEGKTTSGEGTVPVCRHWDRPVSLVPFVWACFSL